MLRLTRRDFAQPSPVPSPPKSLGICQHLSQGSAQRTVANAWNMNADFNKTGCDTAHFPSKSDSRSISPFHPSPNFCVYVSHSFCPQPANPQPATTPRLTTGKRSASAFFCKSVKASQQKKTKTQNTKKDRPRNAFFKSKWKGSAGRRR